MVDPALWGAGVTLAATGGVAALAGGVMSLLFTTSSLCFNFGSSSACDYTDRDIGYAIFIGGIAAATVGTIFIFVGGARRTTTVSVAPTPFIHGGGLSLVARF